MAKKKTIKLRAAEADGAKLAEDRLKATTAKHGTAEDNIKAAEAAAAERKKNSAS